MVRQSSLGASMVLLPHLIGQRATLDLRYKPVSWADVTRHADLLVSFGGLRRSYTWVVPGGHARHVGCDLARAAARSTRIHILVVDGLVDDAFATHTVRVDEVHRCVLGETDRVPKPLSGPRESAGRPRGSSVNSRIGWRAPARSSTSCTPCSAVSVASKPSSPDSHSRPSSGKSACPAAVSPTASDRWATTASGSSAHGSRGRGSPTGRAATVPPLPVPTAASAGTVQVGHFCRA